MYYIIHRCVYIHYVLYNIISHRDSYTWCLFVRLNRINYVQLILKAWLQFTNGFLPKSQMYYVTGNDNFRSFFFSWELQMNLGEYGDALYYNNRESFYHPTPLTSTIPQRSVHLNYSNTYLFWQLVVRKYLPMKNINNDSLYVCLYKNSTNQFIAIMN